MLVAEADPFYRLDTTGPVHRIHPRPAAQAVADNSEEEEMMEQAPITQWEEAELASLTTTFHSETSSQSGAVLVLVAEADPSHRLDTEPESEPVPVAQAEGGLESSVEVMVESKGKAPPKKRGWLQRCLRLLRRAASPLLSCCPYRTTAKMNVLLLKEPRESESGPDPYIKELALYGHSATLIPVLSFKFVSLNVLSDKLFQPEKHGGLIFTSPRAVEAVKMCLESSSRRSEWDAVKDQWNRKSVYVVGKATASLVEDLGLTSCGENSGTADVLSRLIIEREGPEIQPLLFPCGSLKREVLPTALRQNGIPLETLTVYQTSEHPDLEKNITHYFTEQGVPASIAFFSPSGVKFCLNTLKGLAGTKLDKIKLAAVGPTTADALEAEGLRVGCTAEKPTPQHLAKGIAQTLNSTTADL
ncbi:uroporphyrinogen-III synthase isoform X1 [Astyanax mexicanus]|uniref:Uroporphyrinogen-III synthase n=2 Tax=Astyanax mexicanus TaxID=7994 RepID=A0A8T2L6G6_ASTMX|nr:uroporphyrinogen-III synthase isoform X1 [Astyanax mexicanus]